MKEGGRREERETETENSCSLTVLVGSHTVLSLYTTVYKWCTNRDLAT